MREAGLAAAFVLTLGCTPMARAQTAEPAPQPRSVVLPLAEALPVFEVKEVRWPAADGQPPEVRALIAKGDLAHRSGDFEGAIQAYAQASDLSPAYGALWKQIGDDHMRLGQYGRAIVAFDLAAANPPTTAGVYLDRGLAYERLGDLGRALADNERATQLAPRNAWAWNNAGHVRAQLGDAAGARRAYDQALALERNHAAALANRARLNLTLKDYKAALPDAKRLVKIQGGTAANLMLRGQAYAGVGRAKDAEADFRRAKALDPRGLSTAQAALARPAG